MDVLLYVQLFMAVHVTNGKNIILNKPSTESGTHFHRESDYGAFFGNDGDKETVSVSAKRSVPYWHVDLQALYIVFNISVTTPSRNWDSRIENAFIGVSTKDPACEGSDVIVCGQWPDQNQPSTTLTFSCNLSKPVRYVRIWKETLGHIGFSEVEATGSKKGIEFASSVSTKVAKTNSSLSVFKVTECGTVCYQTESCIAFSFRQGGQLNCLLAMDVNLTSDTDWVTYNIWGC